MKPELERFVSCPACRAPFAPGSLHPRSERNSTHPCANCGREWNRRDGILDLTYPDGLREEDVASRRLWNRIAPLYGAINSITGLLRGVSISNERRELIHRLGLQPGSAVLEVAAGTGSNLVLLAQEVGERGAVVGLDLSFRMLSIACSRTQHLLAPPELILGNAQHLPFSDGAFDAVLDGSGIKYYPDPRQALSEMLRVVRPGGKVLVAELGMPPATERPTLRQLLLGLWIPGFRDGPPDAALPAEAAQVKLEWDDAKTFYVLEFERVRRPLGTDR